jgi:alkylation response protein AidB-like acyl-CoA dehydrogenase
LHIQFLQTKIFLHGNFSLPSLITFNNLNMDTLTISANSVKEKDLLKVASELGPILSQNIAEEENNGRLSVPVVRALKEAGFYKLYLPKSLGGLEADPVTVAKVVEEVATHNTAAGWSLMVANTTLNFIARIPEKGIEEIFGSNPDAFVAGSVNPPMMATRVEGGYQINGRNALVSNVHEAQWIMVLGLVIEGGQPKMNDGHPEMLGVYMKAGDCKIVDTWNVLGMRATDSNDVEAKDVFVPDHRVFPLTPEFHPSRYFEGPLYRFPAAGANVACLLAPVGLAVARNAINELKAIAAKKTPLGSMVPIRERGVAQRKLGRAEALVQSARTYLHTKLAECWSRVLAGEIISLEEKADLLLTATHVNQSCLEAVELMYTAAGTNGIYMKNKLAHYFCDAQVLRQHGFMNESRYETGGQVHFGFPPDLPIITF